MRTPAWPQPLEFPRPLWVSSRLGRIEVLVVVTLGIDIPMDWFIDIADIATQMVPLASLSYSINKSREYSLGVAKGTISVARDTITSRGCRSHWSIDIGEGHKFMHYNAAWFVASLRCCTGEGVFVSMGVATKWLITRIPSHTYIPNMHIKRILYTFLISNTDLSFPQELLLQ